MKIDTILNEKFNLPSFRLGQKEIICSLLIKKDVLAVMPTGGGKSLCYQLPAYIQSGITIVVSPLIALMNDQVQSLTKLGLPAGCVHSGLSLEERKSIFQRLQRCTHEKKGFVLYVSPERVQKEGFAEWVTKQKVNLFAIDEAHCVSQWGHDFRKEYSQISLLRKLKPEVPIIALTATATPLVKEDICKQLELRDPSQHVYGFYRPNLFYQVEFCADEIDKQNFMAQAIKQTPKGRILIYCGTRAKASEWTTFLRRYEETTGESKINYYHAGLSAEARTKIEEQYQNGEIRILTATNAFGMGIDHPDVRLVVHTQMPGNVESYYQEVGRAGRDTNHSTCLLLYSKKDKSLQSYFIRGSKASSKIKSLRWEALDAIVQYSEGGECRHGDILTYFKDQKRIKQCGHCDSCDPESNRKILRTERTDLKKKASSKLRRKAKEALFTPETNPQAKWRIEVLRDWRKEYAKENDIPAFMVFSDKTLKDIAEQAPSTTDELANVYGLGEKKIDVFGKAILDTIKES